MHRNDLRGKGPGAGFSGREARARWGGPQRDIAQPRGVGWAGLEMPDKYGREGTATAMGAVGQG